MKQIPKTLRDLVFPHPPNYEGYPQLSVIHLTTPGKNNPDEHTLAITDNVKQHQGMKKLFVSFIAIDEMNDKDVQFICENWDQSFPVSIFCAINNIPMRWKEVNEDGIVRIIGPLHFFIFDTINVKKRKVR